VVRAQSHREKVTLSSRQGSRIGGLLHLSRRPNLGCLSLPLDTCNAVVTFPQPLSIYAGCPPR
jgi:hypothetical protein